MKLKKVLVTVLKTLLTVGIFVSLFVEFGGGTVSVSRSGFAEGTIFYRANPAMPGLVGRLRTRLTGGTLPPPHVAIDGAEVCTLALEGLPVFVRTEDGSIVKFRALHHCVDGRLAEVLAGPDGKRRVPLAQTTGQTVWVEKQGTQRVPMTVGDLWDEVRSLDPAVFVPWVLFATFIKLLGIMGNIVRWQVLLEAQGMRFGFGWLTASYFIGRFFGIVMPSTLGLDGWRLYDTIRVSRKPVECTTVLAIERITGLVGLLAAILLFMPFAGLQGRSIADVLRALAVPLGAALLCGLLLLLRPSVFAPLIRVVPVARVRTFLDNAIRSATAYSSRRSALVIALACAVFGQLTTMAMYFGNAMALGVESVTMLQVFYAAAVMTLFTFIIPTAAGEGVREFMFVEMLGGRVPTAKAFLIGHVGFWIEKLLLSFQGGVFLLWAPKSYQRVTREDLERLRDETMRAQQASAPRA
ncbi:MAG TPA: lysylphosphatidylglycerol synthase transmembrane domain-containing protein [Candidatus Limnocylindria bacterium]|nr:lysylphosphatidylglycerol synthase transmembrane domain-containing protein [Candidatus Limnocylindria bacterium]